MDRILISDLSARCIIGINEEERREKQDVVINLVVFADLGKAAKSDRFEDSVDYRALKKKILNMVESSKYYLLEALAESIAKICLEQPGVMQIQVRVDKPSALRFARSVGVEIERKRES
jgi:FolB domain-containing protein